MAFDINMEEILDHYKHPHNFGEMQDPSHSHKESNPLCGDELTINLAVKDNVIEKATFSGHGCAISMAAASMLTDKIIGMKISTFRKLSSEDIIKMLGIELTAVRVKCAVLSLVAARNALGDNDE